MVQRTNTAKELTLGNVCFVLSPIGREGTEVHQQFREVLDFVIRPAIEEAGYDLKVYRADDIERSGSFIKDILEYISGSYTVIADLSGQNPNVFYELGVRHCLSPRTILMAQSLDDIPSDLREYRTIVYDTSARGAATFRQRIAKYLQEMKQEPHRADNPVLDRLGSVMEARTRELEEEVVRLKGQLDSVLRKGAPTSTKPLLEKKESVAARVDRILKVMGAEPKTFLDSRFTRKRGEEQEHFQLPAEEGDFRLYWVTKGTSIVDIMFVSRPILTFNLEKELADVRVLMERSAKGQNVQIRFIIATDQDLETARSHARRAFEKMKMFLPVNQRGYFSLELWDSEALLAKERELGIKIDLAAPKKRKAK